MRKRYIECIGRLPAWCLILYGVLVFSISVVLIAAPGVVLMPVLGRVSQEDREFAREEWELCKEQLDFHILPIDLYMKAQISIGDKLWYSSIFEITRGGSGLISTAEEVSQLLLELSKEREDTGDFELTPERLPEIPDSRNVWRYLTHLELLKVASGGRVDFAAINRMSEFCSYLSMFYVFMGILVSRLVSCYMLRPVTARFGNWLKGKIWRFSASVSRVP